MQVVRCELCGSNDLVKSGDYFVCQHCGTKYTPEQARKLMIEGPVDVSGSTVRVDNSDFVQRYLQNARRAKQKEDWEEVEKYYNLVEQNDPTNIEAIFYSAYGKARAALIDSDIYKREAAFKVLQNCVSIIDDNYSVEEEEAELPMVQQISDDILGLSSSNFVFTQVRNGYGNVVSTNQWKTEMLFVTLKLEFCTTLDNIIAKYSEEQKIRTIPFYEIALKQAESIQNAADNKGIDAVYRSISKQLVEKYHRQWKAIDPTHELPYWIVRADEQMMQEERDREARRREQQIREAKAAAWKKKHGKKAVIGLIAGILILAAIIVVPIMVKSNQAKTAYYDALALINEGKEMEAIQLLHGSYAEFTDVGKNLYIVQSETRDYFESYVKTYYDENIGYYTITVERPHDVSLMGAGGISKDVSSEDFVQEILWDAHIEPFYGEMQGQNFLIYGEATLPLYEIDHRKVTYMEDLVFPYLAYGTFLGDDNIDLQLYFGDYDSDAAEAATAPAEEATAPAEEATAPAPAAEEGTFAAAVSLIQENKLEDAFPLLQAEFNESIEVPAELVPIADAVYDNYFSLAEKGSLGVDASDTVDLDSVNMDVLYAQLQGDHFIVSGKMSCSVLKSTGSDDSDEAAQYVSSVPFIGYGFFEDAKNATLDICYLWGM